MPLWLLQNNNNFPNASRKTYVGCHHEHHRGVVSGNLFLKCAPADLENYCGSTHGYLICISTSGPQFWLQNTFYYTAYFKTKPVCFRNLLCKYYLTIHSSCISHNVTNLNFATMRFRWAVTLLTFRHAFMQATNISSVSALCLKICVTK